MISKIRNKLNGTSKWIMIALFILVPLFAYARTRDMQLQSYCDKTDMMEETYKQGFIEIKDAINKMSEDINLMQRDKVEDKTIRDNLVKTVEKILDLQLKNK